MLPFDAEVLASVVAQYNRAVWPAPVVALVLGLATLGLAWRGGGRLPLLILGAGWAWTGIVFHYGTFALLNFMAPTYAVVFLVEAAVLGWLALRGGVGFERPRRPVEWIGLALALFALLLWPLLALATPFGLAAAEVALVTPDPTALFTLGVLLMVRGRTPWSGALLPLLWTFVGGATAWVLGADLALARGALGVAAILLIVRKNRSAAPAR